MKRKMASLILAASLVAMLSTSVASVQAQESINGLIAYDDYADIWTMNPDGTGPTQITTDGSAVIDVHPDWSPDGTKLAFVSTRTEPNNPDGNLELFVMNADGSNVVQLTDTLDPFNQGSYAHYNPAWSPTGGK